MKTKNLSLFVCHVGPYKKEEDYPNAIEDHPIAS